MPNPYIRAVQQGAADIGGLLSLGRDAAKTRLTGLMGNPLSAYLPVPATAALLSSGDPTARQDVMDSMAMSAGLFGDILGPAADVHRFVNFPEERTLGQGLLAGAGALPFVPHLAGMAKLEFDPRFDPRVKEQDRLKNLDVGVEGETPPQDILSLADFEGKPFITSMSDRTRAGGLITSINGNYLDNPVELLGGQDYMFNNPGQVWASGKAPAKQIYGLAQDVKRLTGEDPLYMPWRMAPTGGDFAHMTGETMLSYADVGMNKKNKAKANTAIKKLIPGWKGIGSPESIEQFRNAPDTARKQVKNMLDTRFRNSGGLGIGEARLAVADPNQLTAPDSGLMNLGQIHPDKPIVMDSGHPSYPLGVPGAGLGRIKEDVNVFELLPDVVAARQMDAANPLQTDIRAMQMKPYAGLIDEALLRSLGL